MSDAPLAFVVELLDDRGRVVDAAIGCDGVALFPVANEPPVPVKRCRIYHPLAFLPSYDIDVPAGATWGDRVFEVHQPPLRMMDGDAVVELPLV